MTNEELAVAIAQGRDDLLLPLWEQIRAFVKRQARRVCGRQGQLNGATVEDLMQSGYLAMVQAVSSYDPDSGTFLGWLAMYLRTEFSSACGYRGEKRDPLNDCLSLDATVSTDGGETTFAEMTPDPTDCYAETEEALYTESLHETLERAIVKLEPSRAEIMRRVYWSGETQSDVARALGVTPQMIHRQIRSGLYRMRTGCMARRLREFLNGEANLYTGVGRRAFEREGMSSVERAVLRLEQKQNRGAV